MHGMKIKMSKTTLLLVARIKIPSFNQTASSWTLVSKNLYLRTSKTAINLNLRNIQTNHRVKLALDTPQYATEKV